MAGAKAGIAAKIEELESWAVFTHCYGHAFNHGVSDTIYGYEGLLGHMLCDKLIKFSPKQEAILL